MLNTYTAATAIDERALIDAALIALADAVGVQAKLLPRKTLPHQLRLRVQGQSLDYACQVSRRIDRYAAIDDLHTRIAPGRPTLLVCPPLSAALAARCREQEVQFIDTAGNAYISDGHGVFIYVAGRKLAEESRQPGRSAAMTPAVLRLMFGFLADPGLMNESYRAIAAAVDVSTGVIGKAFDTLQEAGLIGITADQRRMIRLPEQMLGEWATGYLHRLRPQLEKFRFSPTQPLDIATAFTPELRMSAWGGEQAAAIVTGHLAPATTTIYLKMDERSSLTSLVRALRLRADPQGPIEIVKAFWNMDRFTDAFPTVPLHLVYADLLETNDSRNLAVARLLVPKILSHAQSSPRQAA